MKNLCFFLLAMLCLLGVACTTDNPKQENYPIKVPFTEYSLGEASCRWRGCYSTNNVIVINSDEELSNCITCVGNSYPAVDFSEHSLVLARGGAINGLRCLDVDFSKEAANEYTLNVTAHTDKTIVAPLLCMAILAPKINRKAAVTIAVQQSASDDDLNAEELSQENLRQTWVLVAKKQGDTVEKWQMGCFGDTYPATLTFVDSINISGMHDINWYSGKYDKSLDTISFSDVFSTGVLVSNWWFPHYIDYLTLYTHNVSVFSHCRYADYMQLQLTNQMDTLYFINRKWFEETYFEFDELHP
ncbi:MAG: hypothetical protein LBK47_10850 [Prevotellaceae bacterium]|jgi:heat shock protein HslJ|nr:hypothetical protein [Prevotellaceae bacterium]